MKLQNGKLIIYTTSNNMITGYRQAHNQFQNALLLDSHYALNEPDVPETKFSIETAPSYSSSHDDVDLSIVKSEPTSTRIDRTCGVCGKVMKFQSWLARHVESHNTPPPVVKYKDATDRTCDICNEVFTFRSLLLRHKKSKHKIIVPREVRPKDTLEDRTCDECGKVFRFKSWMLKHKKSNHKAFVPIKIKVEKVVPVGKSCDLCGKTFKFQSWLEKHRKTHPMYTRNPNNFQPIPSASPAEDRTCDKCGLVLKFIHHMPIHKEAHASLQDDTSLELLKLRACDECGKIFGTSNLMTEHKNREHATKRRSKAQFVSQKVFRRALTRHAAIERSCEQCGRLLKSKFVLSQHKCTAGFNNITTGDISERTCDECGIVLKFKEHMVLHKNEHVEERVADEKRKIRVMIVRCYDGASNTFVCDNCDFTTDSREAFEVHYGGHLISIDLLSLTFVQKHVMYPKKFYDEDCEVYRCNHCPFVDERSDYFEVHYEEHLASKVPICQFCAQRFQNNLELSKHKTEKHADMKKHACSVCNKRFFLITNLRHHETTHTGTRDHVCEVCGFAFALAINLKHHMRTHMDKTVRPFKCELCGNAFHSEFHLRVHMRCHPKTRPTCDLCGKSFSTRSTLYQHKLRHTNDKKYKCTLCGKAFVTKDDLKGHWVYHKGIKNHKCQTCDKDFFTSDGLKTHQSIHTGEKPHVCEECGQAFRLAVSLRTHMAKHHG